MAALAELAPEQRRIVSHEVSFPPKLDVISGNENVVYSVADTEQARGNLRAVEPTPNESIFFKEVSPETQMAADALEQQHIDAIRQQLQQETPSATASTTLASSELQQQRPPLTKAEAGKLAMHERFINWVIREGTRFKVVEVAVGATLAFFGVPGAVDSTILAAGEGIGLQAWKNNRKQKGLYPVDQ